LRKKSPLTAYRCQRDEVKYYRLLAFSLQAKGAKKKLSKKKRRGEFRHLRMATRALPLDPANF